MYDEHLRLLQCEIIMGKKIVQVNFVPQKSILFGEIVLSGLNNVIIEQVREKSAKAVKKKGGREA